MGCHSLKAFKLPFLERVASSLPSHLRCSSYQDVPTPRITTTPGSGLATASELGRQGNMPNDILDPEKDEAREPYATSSNDGSSDQGSISSRLPPLEVTSSKRSRSSHGRPPTGDGPGDRPAVEPDAGGQLAPVRTAMSVGSAGARPPEFEVVFEDDDAENPRNFSLKYKAWVIFSVSYSTWVIVLYSTSYTASIPGLMKEFNVSSTPVATLGLTTYLLGLAAGSLVVAPLSELYGRRPVYLICLTIATLLVLPCCLATSLAEIVVVRFFG